MYQTLRFTVDRNWKLLADYLNINPIAMLREAGLPLDLFERKSMSISAYEYFNLWIAISRLVKSDKPAPLIIGEAIDFNTFSPPVMAAMCSPDFESCAARIRDFKPLIGPLILELDRNDIQFSITFRSIDSDIDLHSLVVAGELVFFTRLIRHATGAEITPRKIETRVQLNDTTYDRFFGIKPEKGVADRITFYRRDTQRPFRTRNESLWEYFEPELRKRLDELETDSSFSAKVRSALMELLPAGKSAIDDVAGMLGTSRRTLQRRLQLEKTNYQTQLNHSRELLARHYLANSDMTGSEISFLIGYDDPGSFSRAFHLWTGMTPESFRMESLETS